MAKTDNSGIIGRIISGLVVATVIGTAGYVFASFRILDTKKVDVVVFNQHKEHQKEKLQGIEEFNKAGFERVEGSLLKIERKLGIYEPDDD